jgi:hypothetical protein
MRWYSQIYINEHSPHFARIGCMIDRPVVRQLLLQKYMSIYSIHHELCLPNLCGRDIPRNIEQDLQKSKRGMFGKSSMLRLVHSRPNSALPTVTVGSQSVPFQYHRTMSHIEAGNPRWRTGSTAPDLGDNKIGEKRTTTCLVCGPTQNSVHSLLYRPALVFNSVIELQLILEDTAELSPSSIKLSCYHSYCAEGDS